MATNVTSLLRSEPRSLNFWVQMCSCRFAMVVIANLRHAWTLVLEYVPVSLNARLAGSRLQSPCLSRPDPAGTRRMRTNFTSVTTESALLHQENRRKEV
jgi:hypothetical protein